jgi:hypothetical protein
LPLLIEPAPLDKVIHEFLLSICSAAQDEEINSLRRENERLTLEVQTLRIRQVSFPLTLLIIALKERMKIPHVLASMTSSEIENIPPGRSIVVDAVYSSPPHRV